METSFFNPLLKMHRASCCLLISAMFALSAISCSSVNEGSVVTGDYMHHPAYARTGAASYDLENLFYVATLNQFFQESSYDTSGGNGDGWRHISDVSRGNAPLPEQFQRRVILDRQGPGQITSFWATWPIDGVTEERALEVIPETAGFHIYIDGEETPSISGAFRELFNRKTAPFDDPTVMKNVYDTSGGWNVQLPVTFSKSIRVEADNLMYFHINVQMFPPDMKVERYRLGADFKKMFEKLRESGSLPSHVKNDKFVATNGVLSKSRNKMEIFNMKGAHVVTSIRVTIPAIQQLFNLRQGHDSEEDLALADAIMNQVRIKMYWDGDSQPAVNARMGMFFASNTFELTPLHGYAMGLNSEGELYVNFPMPFAKSGRIELVAENGIGASVIQNIHVKVYHKPYTGSFDNTGYFHTREIDPEENKIVAGLPVLMADIEGMGHIVGINQNINTLSYVETARQRKVFALEGDAFFYIDNKISRNLTDTGTEDFFCGGWYFNPLNPPNETFGILNKFENSQDKREFFQQYRNFISDPVSFRSRFLAYMEHGGNNNLDPDDHHRYYHLTYYYLIPGKIAQITDQIHLDANGESSRHNYKVSEGAVFTDHINDPADIFPQHSEIRVQGKGHFFEAGGYTAFTMKIGKNNSGVMLRRLYDITVGKHNSTGQKHQAAKVYVDGYYAGIWHNTSELPADNNITYNFSDFIIPPSFSNGKNTISIRLEAVSPAGWSGYNYEALTLPD